MKDLAEQELKLLEAQHPTHFQYLKLQLKEFIHLLDEGDQQQQPLFNHKQHSSIVTQESSSSRKRQREDEECKCKPKTKRPRKGEGIRDDAIHKAEVCLRKIQTLKSLFFSSNH